MPRKDANPHFPTEITLNKEVKLKSKFVMAGICSFSIGFSIQLLDVKN
jgi:hypothetical protein